MEELVANINAEAGMRAVQASMNDDGKLVLSNDTGATIQVRRRWRQPHVTYDGGSGFYGVDSDFDPDPTNVGADVLTTKHSFGGFLKLESTDGSVVRVLRAGNAGTNDLLVQAADR